MEEGFKITYHEVEGTLGWSEEIVRENFQTGGIQDNYSYETLFVDWDGNMFEWRAYFAPHFQEIWRVSFFGLNGCELREIMSRGDMEIHHYYFPHTENPVEIYEMLVLEMRELQFTRSDRAHKDYKELA